MANVGASGITDPLAGTMNSQNNQSSRLENPSVASVEEIKIQCEEMPLPLPGAGQVNTESTNKYTMITIDDPEIRQKQEEFMQRLDELRRLGRIVLFSPSKRFCYIMGLIDYLGKWNMNKRLEMFGKSLRAHFIR